MSLSKLTIFLETVPTKVSKLAHRTLVAKDCSAWPKKRPLPQPILPPRIHAVNVLAFAGCCSSARWEKRTLGEGIEEGEAFFVRLGIFQEMFKLSKQRRSSCLLVMEGFWNIILL